MGQPPAQLCVVFDMDGVIVDSEPLWVRARKDLVRQAHSRWIPEAETAMMGISSEQWSPNLVLAAHDPHRPSRISSLTRSPRPPDFRGQAAARPALSAAAVSTACRAW